HHDTGGLASSTYRGHRRYFQIRKPGKVVRVTQPVRTLPLALLLAVCAVLLRAAPASQSSASGELADRFGVIATGDPRALAGIGVRWYQPGWGIEDTPAVGLRLATPLRLSPAPDLDRLSRAVAAAPGSAWLIGNEPNLPASPNTSDGMA